MFDWNDLRSFLAVARTGSTLAAGKSLRVSQTTAARRVAALEEALELTLFERRQAGYLLTPAGEALLARAAEVEEAVGAFTDAASAQVRDASGTVRLTAEAIYAVTVLGPILRDLHDAHPNILIEIDTTSEVRDLAAGAADVALRSSKSLDGAGLVGRRIAADPWRLYCSREYAAAHGIARSRKDLRKHSLIGGGGESVWHYYQPWLKQNGLEDRITMHHGTIPGLLAAVRSGVGIAALPSFVANQDPELLPCLPPAANNDRELWLLTHERLRHTPRIRVVMDFLAERLTRLAREAEQAGDRT
ncbi:MAG: LysR family transcriptional regulator [Sphingosinicella sp.]|nr:LysR family transcriptional regulator [Sphingosinicella sp.]